MGAGEFYDYIVENFNLDGTACRLVRNIIEYVKDQEFVDAEDAHAHLKSLLGGAFGIEEREIKLYRAETCVSCVEYVTDIDWEEFDDGIVLCPNCREKGGAI